MYSLHEDFSRVLRDFEANVFNFTWFQPFAVLKHGHCVSWMLQSRTSLFGKLAWRCWGFQQIQLGYEVLLFCFCHKNWRSLLPGGETKQCFFGCKFLLTNFGSSSFLEFFIFPSARIFSYPHCSPKSTSALLLEAETFTKFFGPPLRGERSWKHLHSRLCLFTVVFNTLQLYVNFQFSDLWKFNSSL